MYYITNSAWIVFDGSSFFIGDLGIDGRIFWASEIVATLTHVERFYDLAKFKLFYFVW